MIRPRTALVALAVLVVGAVGCAPAKIPAGRPEPAVSAPEPVPTGVLYGRVLRQDGRPATRSAVEAYQLSTQDKQRLGVAVLSLGFFCLVPGFCPRPVPAPVNTDGEYAFPADKIKATGSVTVSARHAAEPGQAVGPAVIASFDHPAGTVQRVPDLRYWEPAVTVRRNGTNAVISWPALTQPAHYALWTLADGGGSGTGAPQPTGVDTDATSAVLDLRPYEDEPTSVVVVAMTEETVAGAPVSVAHHAGSVRLPAAGSPPSRGRPCRIGDAGTRLVSAAVPCPLTDGDLNTNAAVTAASPCPSPTDATACAVPGTPSPRRICVAFPHAQPFSLVVYRTPFPGVRPTVELSADGTTFHPVPPMDTTGQVRALPVNPPLPAMLICLRSDQPDLAGAVLDELSAW